LKTDKKQITKWDGFKPSFFYKYFLKKALKKEGIQAGMANIVL